MADNDKQTTLEEAQTPDRSDVQEGEVVDQAEHHESKTDQQTPPESAKDGAEPEAPKRFLTDEDKREMNLAVRTQETSVLSPVMYNQSKLVAKDFYKSGALPKHLQNETQAFVVIVTGAEMGMKPMQAIQSLYIINGIITLWGKAVPRQMLKHGYKFKYTDESQESCTVEVWKNDMYGNEIERYEETFTFKDAEQSKYTVDSYGKLKVGWLPGQNRKLKMRYNVLSGLIKTYIPEVLGEAADVAEVAIDYIDGEVVNDQQADPKAGIKQALKNRQAQTAAKTAPKAVKQEQGEAPGEDV